jgi:L-seryl-tRNA(Ser) seleniumtransferase
MLLRVHPSNFRIEGFTERPSLLDMVAVARESNVPLVEDLGSGCLLDRFAWEPTVQASIAAGVDLVCISGDKMLGGPQAGIVVGRKDLVGQLQKHPLMRALRVDKLTLAALEGTLLEYQAGRAETTVPVARMLTLDAEDIEARAQRLAEHLQAAGWEVALMSGASTVGGGSAPGVTLDTVTVALRRNGVSTAVIERRLRTLEVPVVARIERDVVVLDLRTVFESQDEMLATMLSAVRFEP